MIQEFVENKIIKVADQAYKQADATDKEIKRHYQKLSTQIETELAVLFSRNSLDGKLQPNQLNTRMTPQELSLFYQKISELRTYLNTTNLPPLYVQQLTMLLSVVPSTSLEAFLFLVEGMYLKVQVEVEETIRKSLESVYETSHSQTLFALGLAFTGVNYIKPKAGKGKELADKVWQGASLSQRMSETKATARTRILTTINEATQSGKTFNQVTKSVKEVQAISFGRTKRISQTETARVFAEATADSYEQSGVVEKYQFLATLDDRTSKICRKMDGKVFLLKDRQIGVNAAPLHAHCRSTEVPYFDEQDLDDRVRMSRKKNGQNTFVPATTTYASWVR